MGSKLRNCLWYSNSPTLQLTTNMYKLIFCLSAVAALPLEDTVEVKEAKAAFMSAFEAAEAGEHAKLAPLNNDVQAPQIATAYMADTADVAEAKEAFLPEFKNVEAGGLADKQAPGPVAPAVMKVEAPVVYSHLPYYNVYHHNLVHPTTHLPYNALPPLTYTGLHHLNYAATYPYTYPLQYLAPVKAEAAE